MTAPSFVPAEVFHASQFIADEAIARGWSLWDFAERVGNVNLPLEVSSWEVYASCVGVPDFVAHCNPGDDFAIDMERVFGISAEFWSRTHALAKQYPDRVSPLSDAATAWYGLDEEVSS